MATERLTGGPEQKFWVGADVILRDKYALIPPRNTANPKLIEVNIPFNALPHHLVFKPDALSQVEETGRSRYMMAGLEFYVDSSIIRDAVREDNSDNRGYLAQVVNHSNRSIYIPHEESLFRFFYPGQQLQGEQLTQAIGNNIVLSGEEGVDWVVARDRSGTPQGINARIDDAGFYVPYDRDASPMDISSTTRNFRDEIRTKFMKVVPSSGTSLFWIGFTVSEMHLAAGYNAMLHPLVFRESNGAGTLYSIGSHRQSHVIDEGTNRNIMLEIESPTAQDIRPNWVNFSFARSK